MKNILDILESEGIEVPEDKRESLNKAVAENYKTVAEVESKAAKIAQLETSLQEANAALEAAKGAESGNAEALDALKAKVAEFEQREAERAQADAEAQKRGEFDRRFAEALDGREFSNKLTADAVAAKVYEIAGANPDMAMSDILASVIDGQDVFKNPQQDIKKMPQGGAAAGGGNVIQSFDQLKGMSVDEIRQRMLEVDNLIRGSN